MVVAMPGGRNSHDNMAPRPEPTLLTRGRGGGGGGPPPNLTLAKTDLTLLCVLPLSESILLFFNPMLLLLLQTFLIFY